MTVQSIHPLACGCVTKYVSFSDGSDNIYNTLCKQHQAELDLERQWEEIIPCDWTGIGVCWICSEKSTDVPLGIDFTMRATGDLICEICEHHNGAKYQEGCEDSPSGVPFYTENSRYH